MTNSVYVTESEATVNNYVTLSDDNFKESPEAAKQKPVHIFVERVVAKVTMDVSESLGKRTVSNKYIYDTGIKNPSEVSGNIYVQFDKWNVTATADKSNLIKQIHSAWPNEANGATNLFQTIYEPWNYAAFKRSFWAINPQDVTLQYGTYEESPTNLYPQGKSNTNPASKYELNEVAYLPENAGAGIGEESTTPAWTGAANTSPSQVIIAATLVDKNGDHLRLAEHASQGYFIYSDNSGYQEVKECLIGLLDSEKYWHKKVEKDNEYTTITTDDIEIKTAWELEEAGETTGGRYNVYAVLTEEAKKLEWYKSDPKENGTELTNQYVNPTKDINQALFNLGPTMIWNDGKTYYYFDIRHLANPASVTDNGNSSITRPSSPSSNEGYTKNYYNELATYEAVAKKVPGYYGVVRNHVYKCTITHLSGLGTPVYNPDEVIIPEKPNNEVAYIAADIHVLSWRVVSQNVDLAW